MISTRDTATLADCTLAQPSVSSRKLLLRWIRSRRDERRQLRGLQSHWVHLPRTRRL